MNSIRLKLTDNIRNLIIQHGFLNIDELKEELKKIYYISLLKVDIEHAINMLIRENQIKPYGTSFCVSNPIKFYSWE